MLFNQRTAHADHVHDREMAALAEVVFGGCHRLGPEPADVRLALLEARWRARSDERVDLAGFQHCVERLALRRRIELDLGRQVDRDLLDAPRLLKASSNPVDVRRLHTVLILEQGARPDTRGELIFGYAYLAALQIGRLLPHI